MNIFSKDFLHSRVYFPDTFYALIVLLLVCLSVVIINYQDSYYSYQRFYGFFTQSSESENEMLDEKKSEKAVELSANNMSSKHEAELATFFLWGIFGSLLYMFFHKFYVLFLKPIHDDRVKSGYINANKKLLRQNRLIWSLFMFLTIILTILIFSIFFNIVLPLYTVLTYSGDLYALVLLILGVLMTTMMLLMLRVGLEAVHHTY